MKDKEMHYEKLIELTGAIAQSKDTEEVALLTAQGAKKAFNVKGCSVFLINKGTRELGLAASFGLSDEYLNKGPVRYMQEITEANDQVPIAIYDVQEDPRIQYPEAAKKEGISSLLGVPIVARNSVIGALRLYTSEPREFSIQDITMLQAFAQICGMAMVPKKIMIIDDDPVIVKYLQAVFSDNGYVTCAAGSTMEGLELVKKEKPDLITLDLQLPDEWGPRFYRKLRKDKELRDIPIIVISGIDGDHAVKDAIAFIAKPFDPEKLIGIVKNTIG